eukprot:357473-Chlamydomonas_euryale.AAC.12
MPVDPGRQRECSKSCRSTQNAGASIYRSIYPRGSTSPPWKVTHAAVPGPEAVARCSRTQLIKDPSRGGKWPASPSHPT